MCVIEERVEEGRGERGELYRGVDGRMGLGLKFSPNFFVES